MAWYNPRSWRKESEGYARVISPIYCDNPTCQSPIRDHGVAIMNKQKK